MRGKVSKGNLIFFSFSWILEFWFSNAKFGNFGRLGKRFNAWKFDRKVWQENSTILFFFLSFIRNTKRRSSPTSSNHSHEILSRSENQPLSRNTGHRSQHPGIQVSLSLTILELHLDAHSLPIPFPPLGLIQTKPKILLSKPEPFPQPKYTQTKYREKSNETVQIQFQITKFKTALNCTKWIPRKTASFRDQIHLNPPYSIGKIRV